MTSSCTSLSTKHIRCIASISLIFLNFGTGFRQVVTYTPRPYQKIGTNALTYFKVTTALTVYITPVCLKPYRVHGVYLTRSSSNG